MNDTTSMVIAGLEWMSVEELERLVPRFFTPAALFRRRLAERDAEIRAARRFVPDLRDGPAATALAAKLSRYLASTWLRGDRDLERLPDGASAERVALHRIARLNRGESLGVRRIVDIFAVVAPPD